VIDGLMEINEPRYRRAKQLIADSDNPSVAALQRYFQIGYSAASNLADVLKAQGDWPRCGFAKGGGGRTCFLHKNHRGLHAFECGR
jgi:Ftsk gamma domain